jgi:hypothetical protein
MDFCEGKLKPHSKLSSASRIGLRGVFNHIDYRHPICYGTEHERYRFWSVQAFPYRIVYRPTFTPPLIVRMVNTARDLGPLLARLAEAPEEGLANL